MGLVLRRLWLEVANEWPAHLNSEDDICYILRGRGQAFAGDVTPWAYNSIRRLFDNVVWFDFT